MPVNFVFDKPPSPGATVSAESDGTIYVAVADQNGADSYFARIFHFTVGSGTGGVVGSGSLTVSGSSNLYSGMIDAGIPGDPAGSGNNRVVEVEDLDFGFIAGIPVRVVSGSGSRIDEAHIAAAIFLRYTRQGEAIPVALTLELDKKVSKGTCPNCGELNQPTLLLHACDQGFAGAWFSRPIDLGGKDRRPAFWKLEKIDAKTWTLALRRCDNVVVEYHFASKKDKDCTFPISLKRSGAGGPDCKNWPKTCTISHAP